MDTQEKQIDNDVIVALTDLARLSQRVGATVFASSPLNTPSAAKLLEWLVQICEAQGGAAFLITESPARPANTLLSSLLDDQLLRPLATYRLRNEEMNNVLATLPLEGEDIQVIPGWLMWRLPLSLSSSQEERSQEQIVAQQFDSPLTWALFLFSWPHIEDPGTLQEQLRIMLFQIAEAVRAVLVTLLVAEHARDVETNANRRALREMDLLKAELVATVSHELRSPLASIQGYTATLLRHEMRISREERREFLLAISDASNRLAALVDRLLELSQLETGTLAIERSVVNLVHLAREAITTMEQRLKEPGALRQRSTPVVPDSFTFVLRVEDGDNRHADEKLLAPVDRRRLKQVLDSLLENAVLYSPNGGLIEVGIRSGHAQDQALLSELFPQKGTGPGTKTMPASWLQNNQPLVEIWVRDHGKGIPPEHLETIFDRFARLDIELTREVNGLGLGLAICRRIIELHDGMIWAQSTPGEGSTFHLLLPAFVPSLPSVDRDSRE